MNREMARGQQKIEFGESVIWYSVTYARRKTLTIRVHPDLSVDVRAPNEADPAAVEEIVLRRAPWILRQQREFERYLPKQPPRHYVSGEMHCYLGCQYRLKVKDLARGEGGREQVKLLNGDLYVWVRNSHKAERVQALLEGWYRRQAEQVFAERLAAMLPRFQHLSIQIPILKVRRMKARWGSCGTNGVVTLNLKLIQVGTPLIDYVIVHELCHLVEHNHSKRYYALLDKMMPDWRERRQGLNAAEFA